jgi:hypothetical protein
MCDELIRVCCCPLKITRRARKGVEFQIKIAAVERCKNKLLSTFRMLFANCVVRHSGTQKYNKLARNKRRFFARKSDRKIVEGREKSSKRQVWMKQYVS